MEKQEILRVMDTIIERANEIEDLQKKLDARLIGDEDNILVYDEQNLIEYAEAANASVRESGYVSPDGAISIGFLYRGYVFNTYVTEEKLAKIREKVLPPTKVTEPLK